MVCGGLAWAGPNVAPEGPAEGHQEAVADGNTEFALDLYARLRTADGNLFLAPHSLSTALAMTYAGARGETERQMADVLHFSLEQERLHPAFAALESSIKAAGNDPGCSLHVANALWGQQGYGFLEEFLALNRKHYGAGFHEVDFLRAAEQARKKINSWVADQTELMIMELLRKGDVDPADALVLVNAIHFKGGWACRFDAQRTQDAPFRISATEEVGVPMMSQFREFPFAAGDELDVLELPYEGDRLSMVFLLPKKIDGLAAVEKSLKKENLDRWLGRLHPQPVRVSLPRFALDSKFDLKKTLEALGMIDAFDGGKADFSGMTGRRRDLFIGMVIHEARVEVDEEGTEAAAATAVKMKRGGPPASFTADHPFLFLVRDRQTGSILFLGRVMHPKA
jgi:serine protease inhibitor